MKNANRKPADIKSIANAVELRCEREWQAALPYYRKRGGALFLSESRFWEAHGQPQRSLALLLARNHIPTIWYDGINRGGHTPVFPPGYQHLRVSKLPSFPGARFRPIDELNVRLQSTALQAAAKSLGHDPLVWIQEGFDSRVVSQIPSVDVFSYFDNLFHHLPGDVLVNKARLVLTQNEYGAKLYGSLPKVHCLFPPIDVSHHELPDYDSVALPSGFPEKRMGYIGSLFYKYFDFDLLEIFLRKLPDWGFVIGGRVDEDAGERIQALKGYANFLYLPFVERSRIASYWKLLDVCLLLYRPQDNQLGSFASKALESLYFGVPIAGNEQTKTEFFKEYFPISSDPDRLVEQCERLGRDGSPNVERVYEILAYEMHPKRHLSQVAKWLQNEK